MHENSDHTLRDLHAHTHTCSMTHKYIVLLHIGRKCLAHGHIWKILKIVPPKAQAQNMIHT